MNSAQQPLNKQVVTKLWTIEGKSIRAAMTISNGRAWWILALLDVDYDAMEKSWIQTRRNYNESDPIIMCTWGVFVRT